MGRSSSGLGHQNDILATWVRVPATPQIYGPECTKAGDAPLQGACGEFDSLRVHKVSLVNDEGA